MNPKIEELLKLLDDENALAVYMEAHGYDGDTTYHVDSSGHAVLCLDDENAAALAFHLRDEWIGELPHWHEACWLICLRLDGLATTTRAIPAMNEAYVRDTGELRVLRGTPGQIIVAALIARELKEQG